LAYVDNNTYFMKVTGNAAGTAWTTLWAVAANTFDQIDVTTVTNRHILEGGFNVWQVGATAPAQAANTTTMCFGCAATAVYPTTMFWSQTVANTVVAAYVVNSIVIVNKLPAVIPLRFLSCGITPVTTAWTAGVFNIYMTPQVQVCYTAVMPGG
jgi:hypothetical protein